MLVLAVVVVLANLLADVLYAVLDPRIRYGRSADLRPKPTSSRSAPPRRAEPALAARLDAQRSTS